MTPALSFAGSMRNTLTNEPVYPSNRWSGLRFKRRRSGSRVTQAVPDIARRGWLSLFVRVDDPWIESGVWERIGSPTVGRIGLGRRQPGTVFTGPSSRGRDRRQGGEQHGQAGAVTSKAVRYWSDTPRCWRPWIPSIRGSSECRIGPADVSRHRASWKAILLKISISSTKWGFLRYWRPSAPTATAQLKRCATGLSAYRDRMANMAS